MSLRRWWDARRIQARARRLVQALFEDPSRLQGTSLRRRHRNRWVLLDVDLDEAGAAILLVRFGILRHPRPYAFSSQSHKVVELYELDVRADKLRRCAGFNQTRSEGRDADDL